MKYEKFSEIKTEEPRLFLVDRDRDIPPGTKFGPVIRDIYIVECCIEGKGTVVVNDRGYDFSVGDCYALFPGDSVTHIADDKESRVCLWCAIDGARLGELFGNAGVSSESPFLPKSTFGEVRSILEKMLSMREDNDGGAELRRTSCIYSLLGAILRGRSMGDKNLWVDRALGIMETNYHSELSISDIAAEVGLDRSYFSTLFTSVTGVTPYRYLTSLRVRKACALLADGALSVAEVAEAVGIDPVNFARIFKRVMGVTPLEYISSTV